ncbi:hypothetical protein HOC11_01535 [archaeon]|nr:hypothetical protein [archaeon]
MKKKKKGQELDLISDIAITIIMLTGTFFILRSVVSASANNNLVLFEEAAIQLDNDEAFIRILQSKHGSGSLGDQIIFSYINDDKNKLKYNLEDFFDSIYPRKLCYLFKIEDMEIKRKCDEKEDFPIIDSKLEIPIFDGISQKNIKIEILSEGYSK